MTTRLENIEATKDNEKDGARSFLLHREQIVERLRMQSWVRFAVSVTIVAGSLGAKYVVGIQDLDVRHLLTLAAVLAIFNGILFRLIPRSSAPEIVSKNYRFYHGLMHTTIMVDFIFLTVALWLVGGPKSPFQSLYLVHVILAGILLSPIAAHLHALFGYALFSGLVLGEWFGSLPVRMPVGAVNCATPLDGRFVLTVLMVQGGVMLLSVTLASGLARLLREGEARLREANEELERAATMRRDFFHIVLHDLKSPISSATMLLSSMREDPDIHLPERRQHWIDRMQARLREAMDLLRDFDVLAALEGDVISKHQKPVDIARLVTVVINEKAELIQEREHTITTEIAPEELFVQGVERLLHEAVANYVSNAAKYTPKGGRITVRAFRIHHKVRVEVEDNGIGIAEEDQKRLFQEFVRVRRGVTPEGRTPGSGLGLSIVRRIIEAHGGRVGVRSQLNQGSLFYLELPVCPATTDSL